MGTKQTTMSKAAQSYRFGSLGRQILNKLRNDNDAKVIIQAENSQTGVGKTTLAIQLCRYVDNNWDPEENGAYWNVNRYVHDYNYGSIPKGSAVLLDEIEMMADTRRSMSHQNIKLSQAWARLRNRNVLNVVTLPTVSMLDKRLLELADYWILVRERGVAQPYSIEVNDFKYTISRQPLPGNEHITFRKIPKSDPDYKYIEDMKAKIGDNDFDTIPVDDHKEKVEQAEEKARKDVRNEFIRCIYKDLDAKVTMRQIAALEPVGLDHSTVSSIINNTK